MDKVKRKVISLGGSTIYGNTDDGINVEYCSSLIDLIKNHPDDKYLIVMGGGNVARKYIEAAKEDEIDEDGQDLLGIEATHLNALLLALLLSKDGIRSYHSRGIFDEYQGFLEQYDVIVTGGTIPGHTTDRVAVQCADRYGDGNLVNVTSVGGIYDKDPEEDDGAEMIEEITCTELIKIWGTKHRPGLNKPIGVRAIEEALEKEVTVHIIGEEIENLEKALYDKKKYKGTLVIPE